MAALRPDDEWYEKAHLRVHGKPSLLSRDSLLMMRQRARRVLRNHSSGSARALAKDIMMLTEAIEEEAIQKAIKEVIGE